jgi:thiol-disulfide isomerase/thioredoxin
MKFFLLISVILSGMLVYSQQKNSQFILKGEVSGQKDGLIILSYTNNEGSRVTDTTILNNGNFTLIGNINYPTEGFLSGSFNSSTNEPLNSTNFYLEPKAITIKLEADNFSKRKVEGSKTELEQEELRSKTSKITDTGEIKNQKIFQLMQEFVASHPQSYYSIWLLRINKNHWPFKTIQSLYYQLDTVLYNTEHGRFITKIIKDVEDNSAGKPAKRFNSTDWKNNPIELNSFKGKFVLLDFWASWCIPCRESSPELIKLYNQYHANGLEIISISIDNDLNKWKQAITKDKVDIWYHLVTNKDSSVRIDKIYGVSTLPTKILINRNGTIIGRFTGIEEDKDLEEMLTKELSK